MFELRDQPFDLARSGVGASQIEGRRAVQCGLRRLADASVITSWRIVKSKHQAGAFDGEGARLAGGRWNSPGVAMIYTAQSAALATLEMLVHLHSSPLLSAYVLIACTFPEAAILRLDRDRLPARWRAHPAVRNCSYWVMRG